MANPPARASVYKNAQGIEVQDQTTAEKWGKRGIFYAVYYTLLWLLFLACQNLIQNYTHADGSKSPSTQARMKPIMTMFPMDQITEQDWHKQENHLWYKEGADYEVGGWGATQTGDMRSNFQALLKKTRQHEKHGLRGSS